MKFNNIKLCHLVLLCRILGQTKLKAIEYIEKLYGERGVDFAQHLKVLHGIGLIEIQNDLVECSEGFRLFLDSNMCDNHIDQYLLEIFLRRDTPYRREILEYIENYQINSAGAFEYRPTPRDNIKSSDIRNFLIELDLVEYDHISGTYTINPHQQSLLDCILGKRTLSPLQLRILLNNQKAIGLLAEQFVLSYEMKRLSRFELLVNRIEHVALKHEGAGYDIKSFDAISETDYSEIFIEVKAVSMVDYRFHMSSNELGKAKELKDRYYVYLLPVLSGEEFDQVGLSIIQDPYKNIFLNEEEWAQSVDSYSFVREALGQSTGKL